MSGRDRSRGGLSGLLDKAGHRVAGLRAFANPVLRALEIEREILTLVFRQVCSQFLDAFPVARAAAIGDHDAEGRLVFRADALHSNSYWHNKIVSIQINPGASSEGRVTRLPKRVESAV